MRGRLNETFLSAGKTAQLNGGRTSQEWILQNQRNPFFYIRFYVFNISPHFQPRCCVPTLVDHDFILWESKAILIYLAEKCPRFSNSMYPKCTKTRAVIHQRLFHDSSEFYVRILDIANLAFSSASTKITINNRDNLRKALTVLEVNWAFKHILFPLTLIRPKLRLII